MTHRIQFLLVPLLFGFVYTAQAFSVVTTKSGTQYGYYNPGKNHPLALIFTTDIKESLTDKYTILGSSLAKVGFTIASIDVTCHGRDAENGVDGLTCWRHRADKSKDNIFLPFLNKEADTVTDLIKNKAASGKFIVVIGVSRGGYLALLSAACDQRIKYVIALAPVTDLYHLDEFKGYFLNPTYSLDQYYGVLSEKHIFMQINNNDDRVGTGQAVRFIKNVSHVGHKTVDLFAIITPHFGHSSPHQELAKNWIINSIETTKQMSAQPEP